MCCCQHTQAVTGTDEQPMCSTPCTSRSLQRILVTKVSGELLPHLFTLTRNWRYLSVALFLESPRLDVIKRDCSVVLGLSSQITLRVCPTNTNIIQFFIRFVNDSGFLYYQKFQYIIIIYKIKKRKTNQ